LCRRKPGDAGLTSGAAVWSNCSWVKGLVSIADWPNSRAKLDARCPSRTRTGLRRVDAPRCRPQARRVDWRQAALHQMKHPQLPPSQPAPRHRPRAFQPGEDLERISGSSSTIRKRFPLSGSGGPTCGVLRGPRRACFAGSFRFLNASAPPALSGSVISQRRPSTSTIMWTFNLRPLRSARSNWSRSHA
jgi:hypothetical protein